mgnify:CR=1 FL=1
MSATTELLSEQIKQTEDAIVQAKDAGLDTTSLEKQLVELRERFQRANEGVNDNKQLLKGLHGTATSTPIR